MRTALSTALAAAILVTVPVTAFPARTTKFDKLLDEAGTAQADSEYERAAKTFGKAVAWAHKKGDLVAEGRAAKALDGLFRPPTTTNSNRGTKTTRGAPPDTHRTLLSLVLAELDGHRNGACVSAPVIARRLLQAATSAGDDAHVQQAVAVFAKLQGRKGVGASVEVLVDYADGLVSSLGGNPGIARAPLGRALDHCVEEGWAELAVHVGSELAAAAWAEKDADGARAALARVAELVEGDVAIGLGSRWWGIVQRRLPGATEDVLKPAADATKTPRTSQGPRNPGNTGNIGGLGKAKTTDLGRALPRFPKTKPLLSIRRGASGWAVERHFDEKGRRDEAFASREQFFDEGGLGFLLAGPGVLIYRADVENEVARGIGEGRRFMIGTTSPTKFPTRAMHLVARGETWTIDKTGGVSIRSE